MEHQHTEQAREDLNRLSEIVTTRDLPPAELIDAAQRIQRLERIILSGVNKGRAAA
jgi:hypothetical protein